MRRVVFRDRAVADLDEITAFVAGDKPGAAAQLNRRLRAAAQSLESFPKRGAMVAGSLRQLSTVRPYLIRYRILSDGGISIISILHAARRRR